MVTTHSETVFGLDWDNDRGLIDQDREGKSIILPGRTDIENTQESIRLLTFVAWAFRELIDCILQKRELRDKTEGFGDAPASECGS